MYSKKSIILLLVFTLILTLNFNVYADDYSEDELENIEYIEVSNKVTNVPTINARHAIVYDRASGRALYGKDENEICKMASTTKIMTSLVVIEKVNDLNEIVTVSKKAAGIGGSRLGLSTNDEITVENLLYGLMMRSGNDSAIALAEYVGGTVEGFADLMNEKACSLGLSSTHFVTPHGLDNDDHYTTAYELAKLTDYALSNDTFAKIVNTKSHTIYINNRPQTLSNTNELLGNLNGVYGVKTGFTNGANRCLVSSCKRGDLDIICVVLGCDTKKNRTQDSIKLINYTFDNFTVVNVKDIILKDFEIWKKEHLDTFTVYKGISNDLKLYLDNSEMPYSNVAINNSILNKISTPTQYTSYFEAPLPLNTSIGKITLKVDNEEYFNINIYNSNEIRKKGFLDYWIIFMHSFQFCRYPKGKGLYYYKLPTKKL